MYSDDDLPAHVADELRSKPTFLQMVNETLLDLEATAWGNDMADPSKAGVAIVKLIQLVRRMRNMLEAHDMAIDSIINAMDPEDEQPAGGGGRREDVWTQQP